MTYASAVVLVYCQLQLPDLFRLCLHSRQLHILSFACLGAAFSPCLCVWYTCLGAADMLPYRHVHLIVSECPSLVSPGQQLPLFAWNQRLQLVGWFAHAARCCVHALLLYSWIVLQGMGFGVLKFQGCTLAVMLILELTDPSVLKVPAYCLAPVGAHLFV
jgi:hypothetical protein